MYKQRSHHTVGDIDYYPEIDVYIPEAVRTTDNKFKDKSKPNYTRKWSAKFCEVMDTILEKEGLRVL